MGFFGFFQNLRFCHTYDVNGMDNAIKILPKISPCGAHAKYKKKNRIYTQGMHMRASLAKKKKSVRGSEAARREPCISAIFRTCWRGGS